jgi:hypothetical protein
MAQVSNTPWSRGLLCVVKPTNRGNIRASHSPVDTMRSPDPTSVPTEPHSPHALVTIKLLHTIAWLFFVGCILGIPVTGVKGDFGWAAVLSGAVLIECAILLLNHGRCPLTDAASRYTGERRENFDIYLPLWLARYNKAIFGTLFLLFELFVLALWVASHH